MPFLTKVKPLWDRSTLTLAELAAKCNISESAASRYLNGKISPPADIAELILEVLGADIVTAAAPEDKPATVVPPVLQIWEVYKDEIDTLQANHANHISTIQANHANHINHLQVSHADHMAALQTHYSSQISDLKRDKKYLVIAVFVLFCLLVYCVFDGLHGDWGLIRYALNGINEVIA
jgi:transcriptional regulator with XRE-family HTH domain